MDALSDSGSETSENTSNEFNISRLAELLEENYENTKMVNSNSDVLILVQQKQARRPF